MTQAPPPPPLPDPPPFQSNQYAPGGTNDIFGLGVRTSSPQGGPRYHFPPPVWDKRAKAYRWELIQYDFRGPFKSYGDYAHDFDCKYSSSLWDSDEGISCLPPLITTAATPDPTGTLAGIHWCNAFGTQIAGAGSGANVALWSLGSGVTPTAITYSPSSSITGLDAMPTGGATAAVGVVISRAGATCQFMTDATGTIGATGHANLSPGWGVTETFVNGNTRIYYANAGYWTQTRADAVSDAPTRVLSGVPNGGFMIGLQKLAAGPIQDVRLFACWPKANNTTGALATGAVMDVIHTNIEGTDPIPMDFSIVIEDVIWAGKYTHPQLGRGILATDGKRWAFSNGDDVVDLYAYDGREADSDRVYIPRGAWLIGPDFYSEVNFEAVSPATSATQRWIERYSDDAFHNASEHQTLSTTGDFGILPGKGGLPWSREGRYMYTYADGSHRYQQFPNPGVTWFSYRKTVGATAATGRVSATTGTVTSTFQDLPGLEGLRKTIFRATYGGFNRDYGTPTTQGQMLLTLPGGQSHAFKPLGKNDIRNVWTIPSDLQSVFDKLQFSQAITQQTGGTDPTRTNINGLWLKLEGWAWPEDEMEVPDEPEMVGS